MTDFLNIFKAFICRSTFFSPLDLKVIAIYNQKQNKNRFRCQLTHLNKMCMYI